VSSRSEKAIAPPDEAGQAAWPVYRRVGTGPDRAALASDGTGSGGPPVEASAADRGAIEEPVATARAEAATLPGAQLRAVGPDPSTGTLPAIELPDLATAGDGAFAVGEEIDPEARRFRRRSPGIVLDCGETDSVRHTGVIFVHGIGSQAAGEILREWGGSIIRVLSEFRLDERAPADPVVTTQLDVASGRNLYIEVELPAITSKDGTVITPREHWVLTEAWWAQRVSPPSFGQMAEWLGPMGAVRRIFAAMFSAQGTRGPRDRSASEAHLLARPRPDPTKDDGKRDPEATVESTERLSMLSRPLERASPHGAGPLVGEPTSTFRPGEAQRPGPVAGLVEKLGVGLFLQAASTLVLLAYGFLRSIETVIPIGPLKDGALTRPIDNFVLNWFGDVYVLLGDPAQSTSVRERLVDAIWDLQAIECQPITVVAHSGGAIVTYETLADPVTSKLRVDRVVTIGEAANLGWRLTDNGAVDPDRGIGPADAFGDLYRSITKREHPVLWTDVWASQDPAPVGLMNFPRVALPDVESIGVWNRLSFSEDHGTYWDNDEEFVIPLLRRLASSSDGTADRFGSDADHERRSSKRRQRVAVLSFWTQFCRVLPTLVVVHAFAIGAGTVFAAGELVTSLWNLIPGHEILSTPIEQIRTAPPDFLAPGSVGEGIAQFGVRIIAVVLASLAIFALRAPPERSALFKGAGSVGDIVYAVALRAVALYLVVLAAFEFLHPPPELRPPAGIVVTLVIILGGLEVGLARRLSSRPPGATRARLSAVPGAIRSRMAPRGPDPTARGLRFAVPTVVIAIALAIGIVIVASPFVAMALFRDTADIVLGTILIFVAFQLLLAVGKWRWTAWDERERVETQRRTYRPKTNGAVAVQMTIHTAAALLLYAGIVHSDYAVLSVPLVTLAILMTGAAVVLGIGIDVVAANQLRDGERLARLIRTR